MAGLPVSIGIDKKLARAVCSANKTSLAATENTLAVASYDKPANAGRCSIG